MFLKVVRAKNCWLIRNEETNETKEEIYVVPEQVPCNSFDKADRHTRLQCAQYLSERNNPEQVHKNLVILENKWIKNNHPLKGKKNSYLKYPDKFSDSICCTLEPSNRLFEHLCSC
jgi:hypothetical protein